MWFSKWKMSYATMNAAQCANGIRTRKKCRWKTFKLSNIVHKIINIQNKCQMTRFLEYWILLSMLRLKGKRYTLDGFFCGNKKDTPMTKSERQSEIAKVYHFTRKLFDAFMSSATDPCYECQATLTENSTSEDQKLNNPSYEIQLRVAISQMKMNEQTNKDQTHNETYVNSAFNNCLHVPLSEQAGARAGEIVFVCLWHKSQVAVVEKRSQSSIIVASLIMCFSFGMAIFCCVLYAIYAIMMAVLLPVCTAINYLNTNILLDDFSLKYCNKEQIIKMSDEISFISRNIVATT